MRLHRRADSLIRYAGSPRAAERALREFASAFHDSHFYLSKPTPAVLRRLAGWWTGRRSEAPSLGLEAGPACAALGYQNDWDEGILVSLPQGRRVSAPDAPFPAIFLELPDGRKAGLLRIGSFDTYRFRSVCETVWPRIRDFNPASDTCDAECAEAVWWAVSNALLAEEREAVAALERAGASLLVVDLTGNGGGTDWADPAARQLSAKPLLGQPAGFIRHPHWEPRLRDAVRELDSVLALPGLTSSHAALLAGARARADSAHRSTLSPCDRSAIWTGGAAAVSCRQLATGLLHVTGWLEHLSPAEAEDLPGAELLFYPAAFRYVEGVWSGPLVLVADGKTASASEQFMVLLRDNDAAVVLGSRTAGAGCGYTDGGIGERLENSGLDVHLPDCARFRRDGGNEVAGVAPDVALDWSEDDDATRAAKVLAALAPGLLPRPLGLISPRTGAAPAGESRRAGSSPARPRS